MSQSIVTHFFNRLKTHGYVNRVDWVQLSDIPDTMKDGTVFAEVVSIGPSDTAFPVRNTAPIKPLAYGYRFSLINQRNRLTIDDYSDKLKNIILDIVAIDKAQFPSVVLVETELGPILQDERYYVYQFTLKVTAV